MCMISVVIPSRNAGKYLQQAVISCMKQEMDLEIVIVDDGSTDSSCERLKTSCLSRFGAKSLIRSPELWRADIGVKKNNIRLVILRNEESKGVAEARNQGVLLARGTYVAFLDSDDLWEVGKLKKQLAAMEKGDAVICNTGRRLIRENGEMTNHVLHTPEEITLPMLEKDNVVNCSSVLARREVLLRFPMERSDTAEDYLTWLKIRRAGYRIIGIDEPLLLYRVRPGSKSANKLTACSMHFKSLRAAGYSRRRALFLTGSYIKSGIKKYARKDA